MRAKIPPPELAIFFNAVKFQKNHSWNTIARACGVTPRTLKDWRKGIHTIPIDTIESLSRSYSVPKPPMEIIEDYAHAVRAGSIGGRATFKKYGLLGTPESRMRGTLKSLETHRKNPTGCFSRKKIKIPPYSERLAEFIGILLGDGGLSPMQATITLNAKDDKEYANYVVKSAERLFGISPSVRERKSDNTCSIVISRAALISFLTMQGLVIGNKVRQQVRIPSWIHTKKQYAYACARGLFDTDGSVYIDKHRHPQKTYLNCAMSFTNHSLPLLSFFKSTLKNIGLHPTQTTPFAVFLRKEYDISAYFKVVGSSNPKHRNKHRIFFTKKYGGVPK